MERIHLYSEQPLKINSVKTVSFTAYTVAVMTVVFVTWEHGGVAIPIDFSPTATNSIKYYQCTSRCILHSNNESDYITKTLCKSFLKRKPALCTRIQVSESRIQFRALTRWLRLYKLTVYTAWKSRHSITWIFFWRATVHCFHICFNLI